MKNLVQKSVSIKYLPILAAAMTMLLSLATPLEASAVERALFSAEQDLDSRTVEPKQAQIVFKNQRLLIFMNPDPTFGYTTGGTDTEGGVTCCTNWNTSTGGTGCASFEDSCPADQFQVDCGEAGCW